jgi:hypothetical protein
VPYKHDSEIHTNGLYYMNIRNTRYLAVQKKARKSLVLNRTSTNHCHLPGMSGSWFSKQASMQIPSRASSSSTIWQGFHLMKLCLTLGVNTRQAYTSDVAICTSKSDRISMSLSSSSAARIATECYGWIAFALISATSVRDHLKSSLCDIFIGVRYLYRFG